MKHSTAVAHDGNQIPTSSGVESKVYRPFLVIVGAGWVEQFDLELSRGAPPTAVHGETRFLVKSTIGVYGVGYQWNGAQAEARSSKSRACPLHRIGGVSEQHRLGQAVDPAAIASASVEVFPLAAGSGDSAMLISLSLRRYTRNAFSANNTTGVVFGRSLRNSMNGEAKRASEDSRGFTFNHQNNRREMIIL